MTKYKEIKIHFPLYNGSFIIFDKPAFEKFVASANLSITSFQRGEELSNLTNNSYVEFNHTLDYQLEWEETMLTHRHVLGNIFSSMEDPIKEIFIPTTSIKYDYKSEDKLLTKNNLFEILQLLNYFSNKKKFSEIKITSEELVIFNMDECKHVTLKIPNGIHTVYEIFDNSYLKNLKDEKKMYKKFSQKNMLGSEEWVLNLRRRELIPPNIHFLYLNFE